MLLDQQDNPIIDLSVVWDMDSCTIPQQMSTKEVLKNLVTLFSSLGSLKNITCYSSIITDSLEKQLQAHFQQLMIIRRQPLADFTLFTDLLKLAFDHKPPLIIVLITGDRPIHTFAKSLVQRGFEIVLIHTDKIAEELILSVSRNQKWMTFLGLEPESTLNRLCISEKDVKNPVSLPKKTVRYQSTFRVEIGNPTPDKITSSIPAHNPSTSAPCDKNHPGHNEISEEQLLTIFGSLIETIQLLQRPDKPQVLLSMLGGRCDWKKQGYPKLRDYVKDASYYGICLFGGFPPQEWAALFTDYHNNDYLSHPALPSPQGPSIPHYSTQTDPFSLFSLLPAALQQLKRQYFKPTETAIKGALKSLQRNRYPKITITPIMWEELITRAMEGNFTISGKAPKRVIYPSSDYFEGSDPDHPETEFPEELWTVLEVFLKEQSPGKKNGRFGFAECLSCKGPPLIRSMPLGKICELVQQALMRKLLEFHKGFVGIPDNMNTLYFNPPSNSNSSSTVELQETDTITATDENSILIFSLLPNALETLKKDMLKPFEQVVQARIRQLAVNTKLSFKKKHWNAVLASAARKGFTITDTLLGKLIYGPQGEFNGVDPRHPQSRFEGFVWDSLQEFLVSVHPLKYPLRYQFATFLKKEGPAQMKVLPLGIISELVEAAVSRGYLMRLDPKTIATADFIPSKTEGDILSCFSSTLSLVENAQHVLYMICQRFFPSWPLPIFVVVDCSGPPHSPTFLVVLILLNIEIGQGEGTSKKEAHAAAAYNTLTTPTSYFYTILQIYGSGNSSGELTSFLANVGISFPLPNANSRDLTKLDITLPTQSCNWSHVASILRNLCDQPSPDNVSRAVKTIESYQQLDQFIAIPGLINAIVSTIHLHYLRDFNVSLIQRLADVIIPLNDWAIQCNTLSHYPALPEASLKILFVAGTTAKITTLFWSYHQNDTKVALEWVASALPQAHPNPAHCVLKLCRSRLFNSQSQEQYTFTSELLQAYESINYTLSSRERQHASEVLREWEQANLYTPEFCSWFARVFQVFTPNQTVPIQTSNLHLEHSLLHPVTFKWTGGGKNIKLAGSFNEWTEYIPLTMDQSTGHAQVILELPEGVHQFKYIVDKEWKYDPSSPLLVEPLSGYKNNYINVTAQF